MVKQASAERRSANRAKRVLSIQYRLVKTKGKLSEADTRWHLSTTHDMSISGLSFLSEVAYRIDDTIELHVVMSGVLDIFKGFGKIVRVEKKATGAFYLMAVKFVNLRVTRKSRSTPKSKNRLKKSS